MLFWILVSIGVFADIQGWVFVKGSRPKPPLFDLLEPIPFWSIYMYLCVPLVMIGSLFEHVGVEVMSGLPFFVATYLYLVSCAVIGGWDWLRRRFMHQAFLNE